MQPHTASLDPRSLVVYNPGFNPPCFMPQTFILAFESLEYFSCKLDCGFHVSWHNIFAYKSVTNISQGLSDLTA